MKDGITRTVSNEIRDSIRKGETKAFSIHGVDVPMGEAEDLEMKQREEAFPHSLKKLKNKPFLTKSEEIMVKHQLYHGKGKRKRKKKK